MRMLAVLLLATAAFAAPTFPSAEFNEDWVAYKSRHNKVYLTDQEELVRRSIWEYHLNVIAKHNREFDRGLHTYTLGENEYADMTNAEFVSVMNGYIMRNRTGKAPLYLAPSHVSDLPDMVDWRKEGYVTEIKNQGRCGSCWSFSATGSLEGQHFKKAGKLVSLSEQNLCDCSRKEGNKGCKGGLMDNAFEYIKINNGIDTEASYPYKAKDSRVCKFTKENIGATDTGYTDIKEGSEEDLQSAVATIGPISVAIDASHSSFQLYRNGVYNERRCSSKRLDHGVLAVGYGTHEGTPYWLVKNSWGESWGMQGYVMMSRNKENQCGIATSASYPLV